MLIARPDNTRRTTPPTWRCSRFCRTGSAWRSFSLIAFVVFPLFGNTFLLNAVMIPFLIFALAAIGLNLLTGYTGLLSLGTGAFMGVGAYACLKLTTLFPQRQHYRLDSRLGLFFGGRRRAVRSAVAAHQGLLSRSRDARGAVFSGMVLHPDSWLYNNSVSGAIEVPLRTLLAFRSPVRPRRR